MGIWLIVVDGLIKQTGMSSQSSDAALPFLFQKEGILLTMLEYSDRAFSSTPATFWKKSFHISTLPLALPGNLQVSSVASLSEDRDPTL